MMTKNRREPVGLFLDKLLFTERFHYVVDTYATPEQWAKQMSGLAQPRTGGYWTNSTSRTAEVIPGDNGKYKFSITHHDNSRNSSIATVKATGIVYQDSAGRTAVRGQFTPTIASVIWFFIGLGFILVWMSSPSTQCFGLVGIFNIALLILRVRVDYRDLRTYLYEAVPSMPIPEA